MNSAPAGATSYFNMSNVSGNLDDIEVNVEGKCRKKKKRIWNGCDVHIEIRLACFEFRSALDAYALFAIKKMGFERQSLAALFFFGRTAGVLVGALLRGFELKFHLNNSEVRGLFE